MKSISVIITTYNSSLVINKSLDSVMQQENMRFEIIIVDDLSDDIEGLKSVIGLYQNVNIRLIQVKQKGNANISRNLGVNNAKYNYIAFLDADDTWNKNHLEKAISTLESYQADICFSRVQFTLDNRNQDYIQPIYRGDISDFIFSNGLAVTSSLVIKKKSLHRCEFDENQLKHQDWEFLIRAQNEGFKIIQSDYLGLNYTLSSGGNMSSTFNPEATARFLFKTLSYKFHNAMLRGQLNSMLCQGDYLSVNTLRLLVISNEKVYRQLSMSTKALFILPYFKNKKLVHLLSRIIILCASIKNKVKGNA
ncbi:TPA: glycosyltransferase family 2 protein [Photobacterium damselae]